MNYHLFGESHGDAVGVILEQVPAGIALDMPAIEDAMARRRAGSVCAASADASAVPLSTTRHEPDVVRIVSGVFNGKTTGDALCAMIDNTDVRSQAYEALRYTPRPSHADYTGYVRSNGCNDYRGGGHFSGRLTAPLVFAGAVAQQVLRGYGIEIFARSREIGGVGDVPVSSERLTAADVARFRHERVAGIGALGKSEAEAMRQRIASAKTAGNSVGGIVQCFVTGMPAGLGGAALNETLEGRLARHLFAVPAVKGVEFGDGFALAKMSGQEANDCFYCEKEENGAATLRTRTNHNGGINGGISNDMPLVFSVAIKPTPSIALPQESVDLRTGDAVSLRIGGRHDPCIVPRVLPAIEAAAALALAELPELSGMTLPAAWCGAASKAENEGENVNSASSGVTTCR